MKEPKLIHVLNLVTDEKNFTNPQRGRVYSPDGIAPALNTCGGAASNRRLLFGLSRTRNKAGWIERFSLRDVTNTVHAQVGAVGLNMEVLIAEFYEGNITSGED